MPEAAQSDFDALGGFRLIAAEFGGTPQGIVAHIRKVTDELEKARRANDETAAKLPKEGEVIVLKADADLLPQYKEFGKPEEIKTLLDSGKTAAADLAKVKTRTSAAAFAKAAKLDESAVDTLIALPDLAGAIFEVRETTVKGENGKPDVKSETAYLKLAGDNQSAMKFEEAEAKIPALKGLARQAAVKEITTTGIVTFPSVTGNTKPVAPSEANKPDLSHVDSAIAKSRERSRAPNALSSKS